MAHKQRRPPPLLVVGLLVLLLRLAHAFVPPPTPRTTSRPPRLAAAAGAADHDAPRYRARGVSATKQEVLAAVQGQAKASLYPGAFCKILPDVWGNDPTAALLMHADGAGSKATLAYAYWRETGDARVWKGIAQDALVMNLDDVYCAGATRSPGLVTSTIARNRRLVPGEVVQALIEGLEAVLEELRPWGVELHLAGGETADLGDQVRTLTVDCSLATRMPRADVVDNGRIQAGDLIVGLGSAGAPARYEQQQGRAGENGGGGGGYNSGIGSNGLTAARHDVLGPEVGDRYPETFDPALGRLAYAGRRALTDPVHVPGGTTMTVGELLLSPTRTYAPVLARLLARETGLREHVHGLVHCTGGGQTKVLRCLRPSSSPLHVVKDALFDLPPVFRLIAEEQALAQARQGPAATASSAGAEAEAEAAWREMYQVFNMGHRLEVYVGGGERQAHAVIDAAKALGVPAKVVGRVEEGMRGAPHSLTVHHGGTKTFEYHV